MRTEHFARLVLDRLERIREQHEAFRHYPQHPRITLDAMAEEARKALEITERFLKEGVEG